MNRAKWMLLAGTLISLGILLLVPGCSSTTSPSTTPPASSPVNIPLVAEPIMENILVALQNNDYNAFSSDLGQNAKKILTQTSFEQLYAQMQTALGEYQSKDYFSGSIKSGAITTVYIAAYSKEPAGVLVTLVLQAAGTGYQVEGLTFDSPNLRGQPLDVNKLATYADPETENILTSLNNNDYAAFSKDLDQAMKNVFTQTSFDQLRNQIDSAVGVYRSKYFRAASNQNNITTAIYLAVYSNEPSAVWVSISFNSDQKVAGLYFNSPKLLQAQSQ
jgi:hypothetical protein